MTSSGLWRLLGFARAPSFVSVASHVSTPPRRLVAVFSHALLLSAALDVSYPELVDAATAAAWSAAGIVATDSTPHGFAYDAKAGRKPGASFGFPVSAQLDVHPEPRSPHTRNHTNHHTTHIVLATSSVTAANRGASGAARRQLEPYARGTVCDDPRGRPLP